MGFCARDIGRMTLGEFAVQQLGWREANGLTQPAAPSEDDHDNADWNW